MSSFAQAFKRIGSPAAVSWPTFWVSLGFNFFLAFAGSFDEVAPWQRLVVVAVSQATMFALLLACRVTLLRHGATSPRPWRSLACFLAAGITRNVTAGAVIAFFLGPESFRPGLRIVSGAVVGLVVFVPTTIIVATWRDYRARRSDLLSRREQLVAAVEHLETDIADRDRVVLDRVRAQLEEVLAVADPAPVLQRWSADVLRPLSHELAAAMPHGEPPDAAPERVRPLDVLRQAVLGVPLMPAATSLTMAVLAVIPVFLAFGWRVSILVTGLLVIGGTVLLKMANSLLLRAGTAPTGARAALAVTLLVLTGVALGLVTEALLPGGDRTFLVLPSLALGFTVLGGGFAILRGLTTELRRTLDELQWVDADLTWRLARLGLVQWAQGARFARALHGPVQGVVTVAIARLQEAPHDIDRILADMRLSLVRALEVDAGALPWSDAVDSLMSAWSGFCDIEVEIPDDCRERLDRDPACRAIALEILTEAVSNAVRHGHGSHVAAVIACEGDRATLVITDNGDGGLQGPPGLGTRILDACTLEWSREQAPGATCLRAVLPAVSADTDRAYDFDAPPGLPVPLAPRAP